MFTTSFFLNVQTLDTIMISLQPPKKNIMSWETSSNIIILFCYTFCTINVYTHIIIFSCGPGMKVSDDKKDCVDLDCRDHACQNGGRCLSSPLGYKCNCGKDYAGKYCEAEASPYGSLRASFGFILTLIICASSLICKYDMVTPQVLRDNKEHLNFSTLTRKKFIIDTLTLCQTAQITIISLLKSLTEKKHRITHCTHIYQLVLQQFTFPHFFLFFRSFSTLCIKLA